MKIYQEYLRVQSQITPGVNKELKCPAKDSPKRKKISFVKFVEQRFSEPATPTIAKIVFSASMSIFTLETEGQIAVV